MSRSAANRIWHDFLKFLARLTAVGVFRIRCRGRDQVPAQGGALVLSNHQSNLDPIVIGVACSRRLNYVARQTLFRFPPLRWLINSLDAIPIDREGSGFGGLKETLKRLKRGEMVLLFPEGTRTLNGHVQSMKPGVCAIARRAQVPIVPVAVAGAFEAWPRQQRFPRRSVIHVQFGPPLEPLEIESLSDDQLLGEIESRIRECHRQANASRQLAARDGALSGPQLPGTQGLPNRG